MIVVTVELHGAVSKTVRTIGKMVIANDGTETNPKRGNYWARVLRKIHVDGPITKDRLEKSTRFGVVRYYPREAYVVWRLVLRALMACYPEERGR